MWALIVFENIFPEDPDFRTGQVLAQMCGPDILAVIHDLDAWDVPQEQWPVSLQIVASNVFWGRDLAKNLQDGIQTALQVGTLIAGYWHGVLRMYIYSSHKFCTCNQ